MKAGPKAAIDPSGLPFRPRSVGAVRFGKFCEKFVKVPKGTDALGPLRLRDWQLELVGSVEDADPTPRTAGRMLPRGQGKSTLIAAYGLYKLFLGGEGAVVVCVAVDERQAGIVFGIARRMVELDDDLAARVQVFRAGVQGTVGDPGPRRAVSLPAGRAEAAGGSGLRWRPSMSLVWSAAIRMRC